MVSLTIFAIVRPVVHKDEEEQWAVYANGLYHSMLINKLFYTRKLIGLLTNKNELTGNDTECPKICDIRH